MSSELRSSTTFCTKPLISAHVSGLRWEAKRGCSSLRQQIRLNQFRNTNRPPWSGKQRRKLRKYSEPLVHDATKILENIELLLCESYREWKGKRWSGRQISSNTAWTTSHAACKHCKKLILSIHGQNRLRTRFKKGFSSDVFLWNACWKPYESAINLE